MLEIAGLRAGYGPIEVLPRDAGHEPLTVVGTRIGITKAAELPWRFCDAESACVSRPWPAEMRERRARAA